MIFKGKQLELEINQLKDSTDFTMQSLKRDTLHSFEWIKYLSAIQNQQQDMMESMKKHLASITVSHDAFRTKTEHVADLQKRVHELHSRVGDFEQQMKEIRQTITSINHAVQSLHIARQQPTLPTISQHTAMVQEAIAKPQTPSSPVIDVTAEIVKIIAAKGKIPSLDLRTLVVDQHQWCAKSSFYRLMDTLVAEKKVKFDLAGREKIYALNG